MRSDKLGLSVIYCKQIYSKKSNNFVKIDFHFIGFGDCKTMDIRQLRYFITLVDLLHFGHAASHLHIAQSALSQQIKSLEKQLGVVLFNRDRRHVSLTSQGEAFIKEARIALVHFNRAVEAANNTSRGIKGTLHIGYVASAIVEPRITTALREYRHQYPEVVLMLEEINVDQQLNLLSSGLLDIGFVRGPIPSKIGLGVALLFSQPLYAVLPEDHFLYDQHEIDIKLLKDETFLLMTDKVGMGLISTVVEICHQNGFTPNLANNPTENLTTTVGLVASGMGISIVPECIINFTIPGMKYIRLGNFSARSDLFLIYKNKAERSITSLFFDYIKNKFI